MKKVLLILILFGQFCYAQDTASSCENAYSLCGSIGTPFMNTINNPPAATPQDPTFGCLVTTPNPSWFYLPVSQSGNLEFLIEQDMDLDFSTTRSIDVDFICWGPFDSTTNICGPQNLNSGAIVDCSYSPMWSETVNIPNATAGSYYLLMVTNFSNLSGYIRITDMSPAGQGALSCSGLKMQAFLDSNSNGVQDEGEIDFLYGNFVYETNNSGNPHSVTSLSGIHTIYDENLANSYDLSYAIPQQYAEYYSSATTYQDINPQPAGSVETFQFPITIEQSFTDLRVNIIPGTPPVPGFEYTIYVAYTNLGTLNIPTGTINYTNQSGFQVSYVSESGALISGSGFSYTFADLAPFETRIITVNIQVPVIPDIALGDEVINTVTGTVENDSVPENNTYEITEIVVGSYDPNDITESRGREIMINDFNDSDYLYYTIRFQNTGTAPAINARIENLLGNDFDYSTVEMLHSSHDFILDRNNNQLTWNFSQILLPAEQDNEPASHGYVYFRVKPLPGYEAGDIIPNTAEIYFDFNPAIVTNTFESEFVDNVAGNKPFAVTGFSLYPNPAKSNVNILPQGNNAIATVKISDLTGKTIYTLKNTTTGVLTINTTGFASGTYFVEITGSNGITTVKKLFVE
ncbi:T9SS type A sorting domain-containing protein [Flavobacterium sp. Sd200]|uniref:T9SS type A sorting domain-containing protein n=1 Tax=Flavobacterium sp. Sd200 TaxID=2692211 RepID=UPI00136F6588|nr:T9SS type A sorting domain-containing protein [Flavobacterium sp. Sd200]MXN91553.1 T9SS type A sorting domain-containing protein [Flavobacterium sp. Sd200]